MALILDTNAISALLAGDSSLGEVLAAEERHHLPVIGEYRYGRPSTTLEVELEPGRRKLAEGVRMR